MMYDFEIDMMFEEQADFMAEVLGIKREGGIKETHWDANPDVIELVKCPRCGSYSSDTNCCKDKVYLPMVVK